MLSQKQLEDVCLLWNQKCCRYLQEDYTDGNYHCMKLKKSEKDKIDQKTNDLILDCALRGINPHDAGVATGNNCQGYPILKHITQGYDVP